MARAVEQGDPAPGEASERIREKALALGFDAIGIAPPELGPGTGRDLLDYVAAGIHGDMGWLEATAERRADPKILWPQVKSVIVLAANYGPPGDPLAILERPERGAVSSYARGRDYHDVLKRRLKILGRWIHEGFGCKIKLFVDTAPVMEKPLAQRAGIGWQGKHTNLVSTDFGSWLFLGEIFTTLALTPDEPGRDRCGSCQSCLDICPTQAFPAPHRLDARRCISYLTIEHKGHIAREFRRPMGNRIYGCDDCLAICPWNKFAARTKEMAFLPRAELDAPKLADLARLEDRDFRQVFSGSPIKRIGRDRFVRNVLVALGNSGDATLAPVAEERLGDASPLVRAMAVWALGELVDGPGFAALAERHLGDETDAQVREEWTAAIPAMSA